MSEFIKGFRLTPGDAPNDGILFVDHQSKDRSGHLGHALVEYAPGKALAFYANCSTVDKRLNGHSGDGWMEYKRTEDSGKTWSEPIIEPNSKAIYDRAVGRTMMCEKAICADNGDILLFYLNCDMKVKGHIWEPYYEPYYAVSRDCGESWSDPILFTLEAGRIFDVIKHDGKIYVLFFANPMLPELGMLTEHTYQLFVSEDNGKSFGLLSVLPFDSTIGTFYGTMEFLDEGRLIVYTYELYDEHNLKYLLSEDGGKTWGKNRRVYFENKLRNPQLIRFAGKWFIHGRSGSKGVESGHNIIYTSDDGLNWDEGHYLRLRTAGSGAYSNSLVLHDAEGNDDRLLIQTSHAYELNKTNILMWWIDKE